MQIPLVRLRVALDLPDGLDRYSHRAAIEHLKQEYSHTIDYRGMDDGNNCVTHAFGLANTPAYRAIAGSFGGEIFAGRGFMEWLLRDHLYEIDEAADGCAVLYFVGHTWQHIGRLCAPGRVTSKWGTFPVYDHALLELPAGYGDIVRYFSMPGPDEVLRLFLDYAKSRGLSNPDIDWALKDG